MSVCVSVCPTNYLHLKHLIVLENEKASRSMFYSIAVTFNLLMRTFAFDLLFCFLVSLFCNRILQSEEAKKMLLNLLNI